MSNKHKYKCSSLILRAWWGSRNGKRKCRGSYLDLWKRRGGKSGNHSAYVNRGRSRLGRFCLVFSCRNWEAQSRFNAPFLKQWTKSLFVPQWNLSLKSWTTSCEIQPCRCVLEDPPTPLSSVKSARMVTLYCWLQTTLTPLIPTGVTEWVKLPAQKRVRGCVWGVWLWVCICVCVSMRVFFLLL